MTEPQTTPTTGIDAPASPAFDALSAMVRDAKRGEVRMPPAPQLPDGPSAPVFREGTGRLPSSWYRGDVPDAPNLTMDVMRAAALGLATGLLVLLPALWLVRHTTAVTPKALDRAEAGFMLVAAQNDNVSLSTAMPPEQRMRALVELARVRILVGDVASARTLLSRADVARDAHALFLMAETYDPNMLRQWRSPNVAADSERARALYAAANALGHGDADNRLAALN